MEDPCTTLTYIKEEPVDEGYDNALHFTDANLTKESTDTEENKPNKAEKCENYSSKKKNKKLINLLFGVDNRLSADSGKPPNTCSSEQSMPSYGKPPNTCSSEQSMPSYGKPPNSCSSKQSLPSYNVEPAIQNDFGIKVKTEEKDKGYDDYDKLLNSGSFSNDITVPKGNNSALFSLLTAGKYSDHQSTYSTSQTQLSRLLSAPPITRTRVKDRVQEFESNNASLKKSSTLLKMLTSPNLPLQGEGQLSTSNPVPTFSQSQVDESRKNQLSLNKSSNSMFGSQFDAAIKMMLTKPDESSNKSSVSNKGLLELLNKESVDPPISKLDATIKPPISKLDATINMLMGKSSAVSNSSNMTQVRSNSHAVLPNHQDTNDYNNWIDHISTVLTDQAFQKESKKSEKTQQDDVGSQVVNKKPMPIPDNNSMSGSTSWNLPNIVVDSDGAMFVTVKPADHSLDHGTSSELNTKVKTNKHLIAELLKPNKQSQAHSENSDSNRNKITLSSLLKFKPLTKEKTNNKQKVQKRPAQTSQELDNADGKRFKNESMKQNSKSREQHMKGGLAQTVTGSSSPGSVTGYSTLGCNIEIPNLGGTSDMIPNLLGTSDMIPNLGGTSDMIPNPGGSSDMIPNLGGISDMIPNLGGISDMKTSQNVELFNHKSVKSNPAESYNHEPRTVNEVELRDVDSNPNYLNPEAMLQLQKETRQENGEFWIYKCFQCGKTFRHAGTLKVHERAHSFEKEEFKCNICGKVCTAAGYLAIHMRTHSAERSARNDGTYICSICGDSFSENENLLIHLRMHSGEKLFKCEICDNGFTRKTQLAIHMRIHTGEKPYECEICGKTFRQSNGLNLHLTTHTDDKPYKCEICNGGFGRKAHYEKHMRKHRGERPFVCSVCGKGFTDKFNLSMHIKTHNKEKDHICGICSKGFNQATHLKNHMKFHSGESGYSCTYCDAVLEFKRELYQHIKDDHSEEHEDFLKLKQSLRKRKARDDSTNTENLGRRAENMAEDTGSDTDSNGGSNDGIGYTELKDTVVKIRKNGSKQKVLADAKDVSSVNLLNCSVQIKQEFVEPETEQKLDDMETATESVPYSVHIIKQEVIEDENEREIYHNMTDKQENERDIYHKMTDKQGNEREIYYNMTDKQENERDIYHNMTDKQGKEREIYHNMTGKQGNERDIYHNMTDKQGNEREIYHNITDEQGNEIEIKLENVEDENQMG